MGTKSEPDAPAISPFIDAGPVTSANSLAVIHLARDILEPIYLRRSDTGEDGYAEGAVLNTRFGSFPHSTLLDQPWGSQIRASAVDTGSRGRKRKIDELRSGSGTPVEDEARGTPPTGRKTLLKEAVTASSGFIHILPPTPEIWTMSLPHRTQVVYTPDYSYILHRIRARPGSHLIEAGAGSGSFTHASVRAVYNGYPKADTDQRGRVFSFEFNEQRYEKMQVELSKHGLDGLVKLSHRDVYTGGFLVEGKSPKADAIFLDLPAPWKALPLLARRDMRPSQGTPGTDSAGVSARDPWISPLNPNKSVHLCSFSPCIEQVTKTVSALRKLGWVEIEMVEIANRKIQVMRDKIGLGLGQDKGVTASPRDVMEAVTRLREVEAKFREQNRVRFPEKYGTSDAMDVDETPTPSGVQGLGSADKASSKPITKSTLKPWMQGEVITRTEPEVKSHTSYLVFAILPREWTAEDEAAAAAKWPCGSEQGVIGNLSREARKEEKRRLLKGKSKKDQADASDSAPVVAETPKEPAAAS